MTLDAPGCNAKERGDVIGGEALDVPEHENLPLARGKAAKCRPHAPMLLAADGFVLGGGGRSRRHVRVELDAMTAPPAPPSGSAPVPTDVHRHPRDPGRPIVGRRGMGG